MNTEVRKLTREEMEAITSVETCLNNHLGDWLSGLLSKYQQGLPLGDYVDAELEGKIAVMAGLLEEFKKAGFVYSMPRTLYKKILPVKGAELDAKYNAAAAKVRYELVRDGYIPNTPLYTKEFKKRMKPTNDEIDLKVNQQMIHYGRHLYICSDLYKIRDEVASHIKEGIDARNKRFTCAKVSDMCACEYMQGRVKHCYNSMCEYYNRYGETEIWVLSMNDMELQCICGKHANSYIGLDFDGSVYADIKVMPELDTTVTPTVSDEDYGYTWTRYATELTRQMWYARTKDENKVERHNLEIEEDVKDTEENKWNHLLDVPTPWLEDYDNLRALMDACALPATVSGYTQEEFFLNVIECEIASIQEEGNWDVSCFADMSYQDGSSSFESIKDENGSTRLVPRHTVYVEEPKHVTKFLFEERMADRLELFLTLSFYKYAGFEPEVNYVEVVSEANGYTEYVLCDLEANENNSNFVQTTSLSRVCDYGNTEVQGTFKIKFF